MTTFLRVNSECREYVTREADRTDDWDRDDTACDWDFRNVYIVGENSAWDLALPFDVAVGDKVYVVLAVYSTGDSFGHDAGARVEYIDGFLTEEKAEACSAIISGTRKGWDEQAKNGGRWIREDGEEARLDYVPWNGYFESLDYVSVEALRVNSGVF